MTSEVQLKARRQELFNRWLVLGEEIASLGSLVQNPPEFITLENYEEASQTQDRLRVEFANLWTDTFSYVIDNCLERWKEEK
jgi:hypothetical protein